VSKKKAIIQIEIAVDRDGKKFINFIISDQSVPYRTVPTGKNEGKESKVN
jgi:hypothetical protein